MSKKDGIAYYVWFRVGQELVWRYRRFPRKLPAQVFQAGCLALGRDVQWKESSDYYA